MSCDPELIATNVELHVHRNEILFIGMQNKESKNVQLENQSFALLYRLLLAPLQINYLYVVYSTSQIVLEYYKKVLDPRTCASGMFYCKTTLYHGTGVTWIASKSSSMFQIVEDASWSWNQCYMHWFRMFQIVLD